MKAKTRIIAVTVILILTLVSANLYAQRKHGQNFQRFFDKLELTKEQKDKIADLRINAVKQKLDYQTEVKKLNLDRRALSRDAEKNLSRIESNFKQIADIQSKIKIADLKQRLAVQKVFTEEQKKKLNEMKQKGEAGRHMIFRDRMNRDNMNRGRMNRRGMQRNRMNRRPMCDRMMEHCMMDKDQMHHNMMDKDQMQMEMKQKGAMKKEQMHKDVIKKGKK